MNTIFQRSPELWSLLSMTLLPAILFLFIYRIYKSKWAFKYCIIVSVVCFYVYWIYIYCSLLIVSGFHYNSTVLKQFILPVITNTVIPTFIYLFTVRVIVKLWKLLDATVIGIACSLVYYISLMVQQVFVRPISLYLNVLLYCLFAVLLVISGRNLYKVSYKKTFVLVAIIILYEVIIVYLF